MKLTWDDPQKIGTGDRQECWIVGNFCIAIDRTDAKVDAYSVMVYNHNSRTLYRSNRLFPEEKAKRQAVRAGAMIARRQAKVMLQVDSKLKRVSEGGR